MSPRLLSAGMVSLLLVGPITAQPEKKDQPAPAIILPVYKSVQTKLTQARERIERQAFAEASADLQAVLDTDDLGFAEVERDGKKVLISARFEIERLLATMPAEGRASYEKAFGRQAAELLRPGDIDSLAEASRRYLHTAAGALATLELANHFLDRDEPGLAARFYERLLTRADADHFTPWTIYKAALAYHRAGDPAQRDATWKRLVERVKDGGIQVGDKRLTLKELRAELDRPVDRPVKPPTDWPIFRGGPQRLNQSRGGKPLLEPAWTRSMLSPDDKSRWTEQALKDAVLRMNQDGQAILPGFFPIVMNDRVIYRAYDGICASNFRPYQDSLGKYPPGNRMWMQLADGGLIGNLGSGDLLAYDKLGYLEQWNAYYRKYGPPSILFENSLLGTLSSDGVRAFIIDDLALSPHPALMQLHIPFRERRFGVYQEQITSNTLRCFNLETGKLVWELFGKHSARFASPQIREEFENSFFLGVPLPLGDKLYVLNEKDADLRLVCLECRDTIDAPRPPDLLWIQTLASIRDELEVDTGRRIQAAHLSYDHGVLICPTNAGLVFAVDLSAHSLIWAYRYREQDEEPPPLRIPWDRLAKSESAVITLNDRWRVAAPAIVNGQVVFTAPDARSIHCVNLRDGRLIWKVAKAADDLYFAGVHDGKVLLVGKGHCRVLGLADGKELGRIDKTGLPTGQGVFVGSRYYLPTQLDGKHEVCIVDIEKQQVESRIAAAKNQAIGNLVFGRDQLIGQNIDTLQVFPLAR